MFWLFYGQINDDDDDNADDDDDDDDSAKEIFANRALWLITLTKSAVVCRLITKASEGRGETMFE